MNQTPELSHGAMNESDIERLESLLWERAVPAGGMPLEMLDGYFSALVCGPELVPPSEYSDLIWGEQRPVWDSVEQAADAQFLLHGYWNHIVDRVARDPEDDPQAVAPAIMMPEELLSEFDGIVENGAVPDSMDEATRTFPLASGWALGFFLGVELREDRWDRWAAEHEHIDNYLADIQRLLEVPVDDAAEPIEIDTDGEDVEGEGFEDQDPDEDPRFVDDPDEDEVSDPPDLIERLDIMFELPHMLRSFDALRRAEQLRAAGPARRADGPGRNDPCPCGSGKKFKKCHGAPARLH